MTYSEAVAMRIKTLCKQAKITPNKLGKLAGLDPSTITSIFYGKSKNPGLVTLGKVCHGLDMTLANFFDDELFMDLENIK